MPKATWFNLPAGKRARVVAAAMAEFGRRGFSAGSLNVVARDAGIAKGSLFQYFDDKLELFAFVCDACSTRVRDHMAAFIDTRGADEPFFDLLRDAALEFVAYFQDSPLDRGVTFASNFEIDPDVRGAVRRVTNRHYVDVIRPLVKLAVDRGELRAGDDEERLVALLVLLLPHLALAPHAAELDPVLDLYGRSTDELREPVWGLLDAVERAFAVQPLRSPLP